MYHASKLDDIYREAQALKRLAHPNIVELYHAFLWKNFVVLIMEYVPGGDLRKYLNERKVALGEKEARDFFVQITDAVEYCHNRGIVHRDLKLENLLLNDETERKIKVIDFGISGSSSGKSETSIVGSLPYMAPESLMGKGSFDPSVDLWSMGVILYLLINGTFPFQGTVVNERAREDIEGHKKEHNGGKAEVQEAANHGRGKKAHCRAARKRPQETPQHPRHHSLPMVRHPVPYE